MQSSGRSAIPRDYSLLRVGDDGDICGVMRGMERPMCQALQTDCPGPGSGVKGGSQEKSGKNWPEERENAVQKDSSSQGRQREGGGGRVTGDSLRKKHFRMSVVSTLRGRRWLWLFKSAHQ